MRSVTFAAVLAAAVFAAGCAAPVVSLNPLFTARDVTADPTLAGTWTAYGWPNPEMPESTWAFGRFFGAT